MSEVEISVVIPFHSEKKEWVERCIKSVLTQQNPPSFEIICALDRANDEVLAVVLAQTDPRIKVGHVDFGDLGLTRNDAIRSAGGRYIALLDGDDLFGAEWLRQAYDYARAYRDNTPEPTRDDLVLHPEYMVMLGADRFIHYCIGDDHPDYDERDMIQINLWSALAFAPKSVFDRFPYRAAKDGLGFEDHMFNCETLSAGIKHRCPPGSMHAIRLKRDNTSLAARSAAMNLQIPKFSIFDKRGQAPIAPMTVNQETQIPESVLKQTLFLHHNVGEYELALHPDMGVRRYPRQIYFEEHAMLRDQIGTAKHVVLIRRMIPGGAEKYAIDWAAALVDKGQEVVIVETEPEAADNTWKKRARDAGVRLARWIANPQWNEGQNQAAITRALIQADLDSVFVCNSPLGWGCIHGNAQVLAKKVFAASFAVIPFGIGFTNCPPFHLKNAPPNLTMITDNEAHAKKMRDHRNLKVQVVEPRCTYDGPSKRSTMSKERFRVLWAGRGTPEKRPDLLPSLAAALEGKADIHVWGDVKPMNGSENLKYRGPFDGFDKIDGSYDCYLMTSFMEGMPNTACEATLAHLPIVGPKVGGLPALTHDTYDKFDPLTVAQLVLEVCKKGSPQFAESAVKQWAESFGSKIGAMVLG